MSDRTPATGDVDHAASSTPPVADLLAEGVGQHRAGRLAEAERLYRRVLTLDPNNADSFHLLGVIAHQSGQHALAARLIASAIARCGYIAQYYNNLASALRALGKSAEAVDSLRRAIELDPNYAEAHYNLGVALADGGEYAAAVEAYRRALALKPEYAEACCNLGNALTNLDRSAEAVEAYSRALAINPGYADVHNNLANLLKAEGKLTEAVDAYKRALALKPQFPEASRNLGEAFRQQGRLDAAASCFRQAILGNPGDGAAHFALAETLVASGELEEAAASYRRALVLQPDRGELRESLGRALLVQRDFAEAADQLRTAIALGRDYPATHHNLGEALQEQGEAEEAVRCYRRAVDLAPNDADEHAHLATALMEVGQIEEARHSYERAIALAPRRPYFYRLLGAVKKYRPSESLLAELRALADDIDGYGVEDQIELHFALGKALEDVGDNQASFRHLLIGNRLKRQSLNYDEHAALEELEQVERAFPVTAFRNREPVGDPSATPIFVVGMPRSGSTLIEQVLASHPQVYGAGELHEFSNALLAMDPRALLDGTASVDALRALGERYVAALRNRSPLAARITDKMPGNFRYLGLIHLALPNARIIHSRREPVDTCLSCFSQLFFRDNLPFTYDLAELGRQYRGYERLMAHWRSVLPPGLMLDVDYETLVTDFEKQARRIVAHCGLEWNGACLTFYDAKRSVKTVSAAQVRRPVYSSSIGRWRPDAETLRPLTESLHLRI